MQSTAMPQSNTPASESKETDKLLSRRHSINSIADVDQKNADDCDELVKTAVGECCATCCMECHKCIKSMCVTLGNILSTGAHATNSLIVQPVFTGGSAFFRDENGEFGLTQPIVDALMTTVGNPAAVLLDTLFSTNKHGTLRLPLMSPYGRGKQFFQLLAGTLNPDTPGLNRVAAITGLSTAVLLGLTYIGLVHGACAGGEALTLSRMLTPYGGYKAIADMLHSNPTALHKLCITFAAYVGFTNGLIIGERAALYDAKAKIQEFWAQVKKDDLEHNIDAQIDVLAQHDEAAAEQAHSLCCTASKTAKAWTAVHATGQVIGNLLSIPAAVLQIGRVTQHITSVKDWRVLKGLKQSSHEKMQQMREKADSCAAGLAGFLGWKTKPTAAAALSEIKLEAPGKSYPEYKTARQHAKEQLSQLHDAKTAVVGVFKKQYDGRESALHKTLKQNYLDDVVRFHTGKPLSTPAIIATDAPPPYNPEFARLPEITSMLNGDSVNVERYQQVKYAVFCGKDVPVQQVYATQVSPPSYASLDDSSPSAPDTQDMGAGIKLGKGSS